MSFQIIKYWALHYVCIRFYILDPKTLAYLRDIKAFVCHSFTLKYKGVVYLQKKMYGKGESGHCIIPVKIVFLRLTSPW